MQTTNNIKLTRKNWLHLNFLRGVIIIEHLGFYSILLWYIQYGLLEPRYASSAQNLKYDAIIGQKQDHGHYIAFVILQLCECKSNLKIGHI